MQHLNEFKNGLLNINDTKNKTNTPISEVFFHAILQSCTTYTSIYLNAILCSQMDQL